MRGLLRGVGRIALWAVVALLLVRGLGQVLTNPRQEGATRSPTSGAVGDSTAAFAVRFARAYLDLPSPQGLQPLLAAGATVPSGGRPPAAAGQVAQAEVAGTQTLESGRFIVTVACELLGGGVRYLAVPIVRDSAGEVAALGAPSFVPVPASAEADVKQPQALVGTEAGAISSLVEKFLAAYLPATEVGDYSYLLAPGATVEPLAGGLSLVSVSSVAQEGDGAAARRTVVASATARDESGAVYPLAYRLELVRRDRWYVAAIEGELR